MKIIANKETLLKALSCVGGIITQRPTLPILSNVLIETKGENTVVLTSTDMEIGVSKQIGATVEEEGSITIPARKLLDIVRELPEKEVVISVSKTNSISITSGRVYIKLVGLSREDFPTFPDFSNAGGFEISNDVLQECLRLTAFSISTDENKYVLNGMLFKIKGDQIEIVATDGRRLSYIKKTVSLAKDTQLDVIIPAKTIHELQKLAELEKETLRVINLKNQVVFKFKDGFIISRLIEGHFPDFEKVIPPTKKLSCTINRNDFLAVIRRAFLLTSKEAQGIKLDFLKNKILVSAKAPNLGELKEEINIENAGENMTIGFNPAFLIDVLRNLEDEEIVLELNDVDKPGVIKRKTGDYTCVIMPMQIS
jgi:DNA polymerase-3 subunit beta